VDAAQWSAFLTRELGAPVEVAFGRACRSVLVARPTRGGYRVRMHRGFEAAPHEVRAAAAAWLRSGRRARRATHVLDAWIDGVLVPSFVPREDGRAPAVAGGVCHDLERLADELLPACIPAELLPPGRRPTLSFGLRPTTRARRSLHLGTYDSIRNLVRVHRVLDQRAVPAFFVRYILFHELLHAAFPPRREGTRMVHHGPELRRRERAYPDYARAKAWEAEHIERLIRSARTGKPLAAPRGKLLAGVQALLFPAPEGGGP
jgi:hypothetical protein